MSSDELLITLVSAIGAAAGWAAWANRAVCVSHFASRTRLFYRLSLALALAALVILFVVRFWSDAVVRSTLAYQFMYFALGMAWLKAAEFLFAWGGLSVRDDVVERGNAAAGIALGGALIGCACAYAGANVGDGPGWWVVIVSAALGTAGLAAAWGWVARITGVIDTITIDRDPAAGVRFGGLLIASGAIAGRAVAGDWHGVVGLVHDFFVVAPAILPLLGLAIVFERAGRPKTDRPHPPVAMFGVLPAVLYVSAAAAFLIWLGAPS